MSAGARRTVELPAARASHQETPPAPAYLVNQLEAEAAVDGDLDVGLARLAAYVEVEGFASAWVSNLEVFAQGRFESYQRAILETPPSVPERRAWMKQLAAAALVLGVVARARRGWS